MNALSVILCTHNPRPEYLSRALQSLKGQRLPSSRWELLLVDNASARVLEAEWDLTWHPNARHVREDELGLTAARLRGIGECREDLIVFVDDDNVLAPDFLEHVLDVHSRHAHLGVFGAGVLEPEFEVQPPPELTPHLWRLALRTVPASVWSNNPKDWRILPWGAGLVVTRRVAELFRSLLGEMAVRGVVGRRGQRLFCGEDDVFSWASVAAGLGFGLFPQLRITHLIAARRLSQDYFLRLIHDHAFSHGVLDFVLGGASPRRADAPTIARLCLHALRKGLRSARFKWAEISGGAAARRFVTEQKLHPIQFSERVPEPWAGPSDG